MPSCSSQMGAVFTIAFCSLLALARSAAAEGGPRAPSTAGPVQANTQPASAAAPKQRRLDAPPIRFVSANGELKWFSEDELRGIIGPARYQDFRASELSLNEWISEQNEESLALTIVEVAFLTIATLGVIAGGALMLEGATSPDPLAQGIGFGIGLPTFAVGAGFGALGAYLVWEDNQDRGHIHHPELASATQSGQHMAGMGLALSACW